jgi:hypothetical protein
MVALGVVASKIVTFGPKSGVTRGDCAPIGEAINPARRTERARMSEVSLEEMTSDRPTA